MHLAQVNIGRVLGGPDDPRMADFYASLARVNALAERMPGFVWRLKDETGDSAMMLHWPGDAATAQLPGVTFDPAAALVEFEAGNFIREA